MLTALTSLEQLKKLEQLNFSGQLSLTDLNNLKWIFYLYQGQIVYVLGGLHPVRRWRRNLIWHCPLIPTYRLAWQIDLAKINDAKFTYGWEYALLDHWVTQEKITRQQAERMIDGVVTDAMFELLQATNLTEHEEPTEMLLSQLEPIPVESTIARVEQQWERWQTAQLTQISPNQTLTVRQPGPLTHTGASQIGRELVKRLDGEKTLSDLALELERDVIEVATALRPLIQMGWLELNQTPDLPAPIYRQRLFSRPLTSLAPTRQAPSGLIACVDDSAFVRNMLQTLLTNKGYKFLGIDEPLRAVGLLLTHKPDLIFLDLVMPNIGGHELCEQIRKISCFKTTPIVILTGNDGFANRFRSNVVGATDFLAKPLEANVVLDIVRRHLVSSPSIKS